MRALLLAFAVLLCGATPALAAGTIERTSATSTFIRYEAVGVANVVATDVIEPDGDIVVTVSETGISIDGAGNGCVDNGDSIVCTFAAAERNPRLSATLSDQDDSFDASGLTLTPVSVSDDFPGGGADTVLGSNAAVSLDGGTLGDNLLPGGDGDTVFAGAGDDHVGLGAEGANFVDEGPGDDTLIFTQGAAPDPLMDIYRGGDGRDQIYPRAVSDPPLGFTVDLQAQTVSVIGSTDPADSIEGYEDAKTDDGDDVLIGTDGRNLLEGGAGEDRLVGLLGPDHLRGEGGEDRLEAQDGFVDIVDGGPSVDTCLIDQLDEHTECEGQELANVTPFGAILPDVVPPGCVVRGLAKRPPTRRLARRGLAFEADCDEASRVTAVLTGRLRKAAPGVGLARAGDIELARAGKQTNAQGEATLRLRVKRGLRRLIRRGARLKVTLYARDALGNRARPRVRGVRPK